MGFQKIIHSEFLDFEKNVEEGVIRTFRSLSIVDDKIDLEKDNDFHTKNALAGSYDYYSFGWTDPRGLYGSIGA